MCVCVSFTWGGDGRRMHCEKRASVHSPHFQLYTVNVSGALEGLLIHSELIILNVTTTFQSSSGYSTNLSWL